jgi:hypothetical protein
MDKRVNVILLNWSGLSGRPLGSTVMSEEHPEFDIPLYDKAAKNCIDVGEYFGRCLAELTSQTDYPGTNMHLVGHSLGSHVMGKVGRTYQSVINNKFGRISGLDPAAPRFTNATIDPLPVLAKNRLSPDSASFVDVIHTFGSTNEVTSVCGDINPLGHMDFYPNGGEIQPGCGHLRPVCNHRRSTFYFLHSIWEGTLFPSVDCMDIDTCTLSRPEDQIVGAYMGEKSQNYFSGENKLFFVAIEDEHWDYDQHY